jgi:ATP/maltotriose-dependent transcriptional regulator MalT
MYGEFAFLLGGCSADDLRFTLEEAVAFLNEVMNLGLTQQQIAILESRTEGWVAGLQLAGLSLQGLLRDDVDHLIKAFAGSHRYVMDYLSWDTCCTLPNQKDAQEGRSRFWYSRR